jgi:hypothetical protein
MQARCFFAWVMGCTLLWSTHEFIKERPLLGDSSLVADTDGSGDGLVLGTWAYGHWRVALLFVVLAPQLDRGYAGG